MYPGMGVGLFLAAKIVGEHGGEIHVESELGEGSTFTFTIPFASQPVPLLPQGRSGKP